MQVWWFVTKSLLYFRVFAALMSGVPEVLISNISSLSEGESPRLFILFWLKPGVHYHSFLILCHRVRPSCISHRQNSVIVQHTQIVICCPHFRYIQYNINALYCFFRRCGPLLKMLLYQRLVSFHFLFIQNSPYQLGNSRLANIRIFNLYICSIYCFGVFPSLSPLGAFLHRDLSAASSLMDYLSSTEFRAESDSGMDWLFFFISSVLSSSFLSFQTLVECADPTDPLLLRCTCPCPLITKACFSWQLKRPSLGLSARVCHTMETLHFSSGNYRHHWVWESLPEHAMIPSPSKQLQLIRMVDLVNVAVAAIGQGLCCCVAAVIVTSCTVLGCLLFHCSS